MDRHVCVNRLSGVWSLDPEVPEVGRAACRSPRHPPRSRQRPTLREVEPLNGGRMPLYEMTEEGLASRPSAGFAELGIKERQDIQRRLRDDISVLDDDLLVIAEEFGNWEDARRRIDLLAIDRSARLVVIELKRTDDGGHMELQALRYAAMVSSMTFDDVVATLGAHQAKMSPGVEHDPKQELLNWLESADVGDSSEISTEVRIVLVSADFGREITTTVLWLNGFDGIDIRCVRLVPYPVDGRVLLDIQQVIPLPEAADYQVKVRRKEVRRERARTAADGRDMTRYHVIVDGQESEAVPKRQAIRQMILALHEKGVPMAELRSLMPTAGKIRSVAGLHPTPERLASALVEDDPNVDVLRWFTDFPVVEETNDRTWVLYKMWGTDTLPAMSTLVGHYPDLGVAFRAAE
jgi:hypothetical protein